MTKKAKVEAKAAHTPGPWKAGFIADSARRLVWQAVESPDRFALATVGRYLHCYRDGIGNTGKVREISPEEAEANARLISAAPDLLAAAKRAVAKYQDSTCIVPACDCEVCQLMAAIAKATL